MRSQRRIPEGTRSRAGVLVLALALLPSASLEAQATAAPPVGQVARRVSDAVQAAVATDSLVGATVAVGRGDEVLVAGGWGWADVENDIPVTTETIMKIGSVSKQFASSLVMQLVEEGKVALDDPLSRFLPGYSERWEEVTIRELLNHTSGIVSYTGLDHFSDRIAPLDLSDDELVGLFKDLPFDFPPGSNYKYNNSGYYLLGMVIRKVTGMPYRTALKRRILDPLGLQHTYYCDDEPIIPYRAQGYDYVDGAIRNTTHVSMEQPGAAGAMCSTPLDLVRWTRALYGGKVVSAESLRKMTTPVQPADMEDVMRYGFGLEVDELAGHRVVRHGGSINGFNADLAYYPDDDVIVAVIVNVGIRARTLARRLAGIALGTPERGGS